MGAGEVTTKRSEHHGVVRVSTDHAVFMTKIYTYDYVQSWSLLSGYCSSQVEEDTKTRISFFISSSSSAHYPHEFTIPVFLQGREQATSQLEFVTFHVRVYTLEMLKYCVRKWAPAFHIPPSFRRHKLWKGAKHVCTLHKTTGKGNPQFVVYKYKASTARRNSKNVSWTERTDPRWPNFVSVFSTNSSSNHCVG